MRLQSGKFIVTRTDSPGDPTTLEKDGLVIGRLGSCDIVLNHSTVSRIHAGINLVEGQYFLINLSVANSLTLNGRLLTPEQVDALADGDIIQIGPFAIIVSRKGDTLSLIVTHQFTSDVTNSTKRLPSLAEIMPQQAAPDVSDVLKVFWEKRTREKEDWGSLLRPVGKPLPGKARINWRPTGDLAPPWRGGLFSWSLILIALFSVLGFYLYPQIFAPAELSSPHVRSSFSSVNAAGGLIANRTNANSCTTCHSWNVPLNDACTKCHQADAFHATNTPAHESAGIGCTSCHAEHRGENFEPRLAALESCASCHNDNNQNVYNGKTVRTPHKNSYGYPVENGHWKWSGLKPETAAMTPEVIKFQKTDEPEHIRRSKEFHAVHLYRIKPVPGMKTDSAGAMSCSSCHTSFDPVDREVPRQICAQCHNGYVDQRTGRTLIAADQPNCVSCHIQHYYDKNRWRDYLNSSTEAQRVAAIDAQIKRLRGEKTRDQ
jgi:pSer/pThr/pTyr-binding forkhead associated (FHA) protein